MSTLASERKHVMPKRKSINVIAIFAFLFLKNETKRVDKKPAIESPRATHKTVGTSGF